MEFKQLFTHEAEWVRTLAKYFEENPAYELKHFKQDLTLGIGYKDLLFEIWGANDFVYGKFWTVSYFEKNDFDGSSWIYYHFHLEEVISRIEEKEKEIKEKLQE